MIKNMSVFVRRFFVEFDRCDEALLSRILITTNQALQQPAVARSENLGGHVVLGGDNVSPLVEIGLSDLPTLATGLNMHT